MEDKLDRKADGRVLAGILQKHSFYSNDKGTISISTFYKGFLRLALCLLCLASVGWLTDGRCTGSKQDRVMFGAPRLFTGFFSNYIFAPEGDLNAFGHLKSD